jgi:hypothetical protein
MIFRTKQELAEYNWCYRQKVTAMIKRDEVKILYLWKKRIGYVIVKDFIKYLLD